MNPFAKASRGLLRGWIQLATSHPTIHKIHTPTHPQPPVCVALPLCINSKRQPKPTGSRKRHTRYLNLDAAQGFCDASDSHLRTLIYLPPSASTSQLAVFFFLDESFAKRRDARPSSTCARSPLPNPDWYLCCLEAVPGSHCHWHQCWRCLRHVGRIGRAGQRWRTRPASSSSDCRQQTSGAIRELGRRLFCQHCSARLSVRAVVGVWPRASHRYPGCHQRLVFFFHAFRRISRALPPTCHMAVPTNCRSADFSRSLSCLRL